MKVIELLMVIDREEEIQVVNEDGYVFYNGNPLQMIESYITEKPDSFEFQLLGKKVQKTFSNSTVVYQDGWGETRTYTVIVA